MTAHITYGTRVEGPLWPEPIHIFANPPLPDGGPHRRHPDEFENAYRRGNIGNRGKRSYRDPILGIDIFEISHAVLGLPTRRVSYYISSTKNRGLYEVGIQFRGVSYQNYSILYNKLFHIYGVPERTYPAVGREIPGIINMKGSYWDSKNFSLVYDPRVPELQLSITRN